VVTYLPDRIWNSWHDWKCPKCQSNTRRIVLRQYIGRCFIGLLIYHQVMLQNAKTVKLWWTLGITNLSKLHITKYESELVNKLHMDIKRKTCDIRTWKRHLFLDISSTNIGTLVSSLYQCVETHSKEVFWLLSQPLPRFRTSVSTSSSSVKRFPPSCEPLYATDTSHPKLETLLYKCPLHWFLLPTRKR
jgi:hypothetical protein